jgi:hypothetical protein
VVDEDGKIHEEEQPSASTSEDPTGETRRATQEDLDRAMNWQEYLRGGRTPIDPSEYDTGEGSGDPMWDARPGVSQPNFDGTGGMCRYFELRDPSQELRRDADRLGLFDDGWFTIGDFSLLFADRLNAESADYTLTVIEGPTTHSDLTQEGLQVFADLIVETD